MTDAGSHPVTYTGYYGTESRAIHGVVPVEEVIALYVNGQPLVSLMCTPIQLEELALGFLFNAGLIETLDDVAVVDVSGGGCVDVWLARSVDIPMIRVVTSGCSGGTAFEEALTVHHQVESGLCVTPIQVTSLMDGLARQALVYHRAGGLHIAGLVAGERWVCTAEDIGRHNALDKVAGLCLRKGYSTRDTILLTSGRVSAEMVQKAARMRVPIVVSRTAPTSLSVQLATAWDITLIGYTRRRSFRVYTGAQRVGAAATAAA